MFPWFSWRLSLVLLAAILGPEVEADPRQTDQSPRHGQHLTALYFAVHLKCTLSAAAGCWARREYRGTFSCALLKGVALGKLLVTALPFSLLVHLLQQHQCMYVCMHID